MATNLLVGVAIKPVDCWSTKKYKRTTQQLCNLGFFCDDFSSIKIRKENESVHVRVLTREGQIVRLGNHLGSIAASRDQAPLGIFDGCRGARIMGKRQKRSCVRPDYRIKSQNALGHKAALIGNRVQYIGWQRLGLLFVS